MYLVPRHATSGQRRCYQPAPGGGEFGRIAGGWGERCRSSGRRSGEDPAASRSWTSTRPRPLHRARLRSRWCCQRTEASAAVLLRLVAGPGVDAVGGPPHGYFTDDGEVRVAARRCPHRLRAVLAGVISNLIGEVDRPVGTASPDTHPKRDDHEALAGCREAKAAALGWWVRVLGGASPGRRPCLPRVEFASGGRCVAGGGVGAPRSRPPR